MFYIINNLFDGVVKAVLNSSVNVYLGPGAKSRKILASEIHNNSRLKRLQERGIIDLIEVEEKKPSAKKTKKKAKRSKNKAKTPGKAKKAKAGKSPSNAGPKKKNTTK